MRFLKVLRSEQNRVGVIAGPLLPFVSSLMPQCTFLEANIRTICSIGGLWPSLPSELCREASGKAVGLGAGAPLTLIMDAEICAQPHILARTLGQICLHSGLDQGAVALKRCAGDAEGIAAGKAHVCGTIQITNDMVPANTARKRCIDIANGGDLPFGAQPKAGDAKGLGA